MRAKRKLSTITDKEQSLGMESPQKKSNTDQSPMSSPLKGPLVEGDDESGSPCFVAKCFYGLKGSSSGVSKENHSSPKRKNVRNANSLRANSLSTESTPKILQDVRMNDKLLERIAASPIKQAVLQRCSVDEFRKLYRDEIKEIELEKDFDDRRITRKLSKIVWKQNEDSDNGGWDDSSSDGGISFKIPNRGFDIDSISNCSSSVKSEKMVTPLRRNIINSPADSAKEGPSSEKKISPDMIDTPPSASSGRKFFKSKSVGQSVGASNVLLGKGFNLRFVAQKRASSAKKKSNKRTSQSTGGKIRKLNRIGPSPLGSTVLTASSSLSAEGSTSTETTPSQPRISEVVKSEKYNGDGFDDDDFEMVMVNKDNSCKTYGMETPKQQRQDYSSGNESPYDSMDDYSPMETSDSKDARNVDVVVSCKPNDQEVKSETESTETVKKLFPIFKKTRSTSKLAPESQSSVEKATRFGNKVVKDDQNQMIIDAGQKKFGATQCNVCGMVYCHADPTDETSHAKFHKRLLEVLRFPGWKKERVVQENPVDCSKIILILSDDPRSHRKKVEEIYEVMGRELGFPGDTPFSNPYRKVFIYVSMDREIEGCCVAEPIKEGNRVIPGDLDASDASGRRPWCCEKGVEPALMGISRLWVAAQKRRSGVASRLVEAVQQWFDYGSFIPKDKIAFSDPTPDGRRFAHKFTGTPTFLVYKYK